MQDWTYKKGDSYGNEVGVLVEDKKSRIIYREIKEALRDGKVLFLRKKKKFVDASLN